MEKERSSKIIAIVALCVGIVGLSLGFAAFSSNLSIKSSATVNPSADTFVVEFTKVEEDETLSTEGVAGAPSVGSEERTDGDETITVSTIGNLSAAFTAPGQKVVYNAVISNLGEYEAFLKSVSAATKTCVIPSGATTTPEYVNKEGDNNDACDGISLKVTVDGTDYSAGNAAIAGKSIAVDGEHAVVVTIEYAANAVRADGPFNVEFTDIDLVYASA